MNPTEKPLLEVRRLSRRYGAKSILANLQLCLSKGEVLMLSGTNGAGKTTLLECVLGLRQPDVAEVLWEGLPVVPGPGVWAGKIGALLQGESLPPLLKVEECLELYAAGAQETHPLELLLADWGLTPLASARIDSLSGGQRQKVCLALAFLPKACCLFLDEPTTALDAEGRVRLARQIRERKAAGVSFLIASHERDYALFAADRCAVLRGSCIEMLDTNEVARSGASGLLEVGFAPEAGREEILALGGVARVEAAGRLLRIHATDVAVALASLSAWVEAGGRRWTSLHLEPKSGGEGPSS